MNDQQRAIVLLMKSAITGERYSLPESFSLEQSLPLIKKHHMITLIYDGALTCGISSNEPAMQQLLPFYLRLFLRCEQQQTAIENLRLAFQEANIDHMLLKGSRMRKLYPKPELRYMGDADILIRVQQYDRIRPLMLELGYQERTETDHELPWSSSALKLELHKRLIPAEHADWYSYYGDGWKLANPASGSEYTMKPEDEWIFLFTHFAKHFRVAGVGCRYVTDLWVWCRVHPDMDEEYIRGIMKTLQMDRFYDNMRRLMAYWFADEPGDALLEKMTQYIFDSGSWGKESEFAVSKAVRDMQRSTCGFSGRTVYIWKSLFPPVEKLRYEYPILRKYMWLLPVMWLHRNFQKIFVKPDVLSRKLKNVQNVTSGKLNQKQELLDLVGLDYHF